LSATSALELWGTYVIRVQRIGKHRYKERCSIGHHGAKFEEPRALLLQLQSPSHHRDANTGIFAFTRQYFGKSIVDWTSTYQGKIVRDRIDKKIEEFHLQIILLAIQ